MKNYMQSTNVVNSTSSINNDSTVKNNVNAAANPMVLDLKTSRSNPHGYSSPARSVKEAE